MSIKIKSRTARKKREKHIQNTDPCWYKKTSCAKYFNCLNLTKYNIGQISCKNTQAFCLTLSNLLGDVDVSHNWHKIHFYKKVKCCKMFFFISVISLTEMAQCRQKIMKFGNWKSIFYLNKCMPESFYFFFIDEYQFRTTFFFAKYIFWFLQFWNLKWLLTLANLCHLSIKDMKKYFGMFNFW